MNFHFHPRYKIMCHPENLAHLTYFLEIQKMDERKLADMGADIITDPTMPVFRKEWHFPNDRFIEYEFKDEAWARPLGFGKEVETTERLFYMIDVDRIITYNMMALPVIQPGLRLSFD